MERLKDVALFLSARVWAQLLFNRRLPRMSQRMACVLSINGVIEPTAGQNITLDNLREPPVEPDVLAFHTLERTREIFGQAPKRLPSNTPSSITPSVPFIGFFSLMTTFLLTMRTNSGITMAYADLGNVPLSRLCSIRMCMVGVHQGRPESHSVTLIN